MLNMDGKKAAVLMIDNSGISPSELSARLHKSRTYINTLRRQKSAPSMPTFARLAHECGYKLKLERSDGKQIELYNEDDADDFRDQDMQLRSAITEEEAWPSEKLTDVSAAYSSESDNIRTVSEEEWELMETDPDSPRGKELYESIIAEADDPEQKKQWLDEVILSPSKPTPPNVAKKIQRVKEDPEYARRLVDTMKQSYNLRRQERQQRMKEEEDFFVKSASASEDKQS